MTIHTCAKGAAATAFLALVLCMLWPAAIGLLTLAWVLLRNLLA